MKVGVAFYYSNLKQYPFEWIKKCFDSIVNQTFRPFDIYILQYDESDSELNELENYSDVKFFFKKMPLPNYAAAMNYIYEWIFETCDVAVNVNIDDYYDSRRIEILLKALEDGADIASSNYHIIDNSGNIKWSTNYANRDVYQQFKEGSNPVSNPCHIMHRRVFESGLRFEASLVPIEDYYFWLKAMEAGFKISIRPEYLHFYRQHKDQATHTHKK